MAAQILTLVSIASPSNILVIYYGFKIIVSYNIFYEQAFAFDRCEKLEFLVITHVKKRMISNKDLIRFVSLKKDRFISNRHFCICYSFPTKSMPGFNVSDPGFQLAGQTSPCSAANLAACTLRNNSLALRPIPLSWIS